MLSQRLLNLKLGPFVDTARVTDSLPGLGLTNGSGTWVPIKVRHLGFGLFLPTGRTPFRQQRLVGVNAAMNGSPGRELAIMLAYET